MVVAGWLSICGATYNFDMSALLAKGSRPMMQLIWIGTAFVIAIGILLVEKDFYELAAPILYLILLGVLVLTIIVAPEIKGSRSWLVLGPLRLQPAEFSKVATALMLGWQLNKYGFQLKGLRSYAVVAAIILTPMILIVLQKETGSALVFAAFFLALYREGFSGILLGIALSAGLIFVTVLKLDDMMFWGHTPAGDWSVTLMIVAVMAFLIWRYFRKKGRYFWAISSLVVFGLYAVAIVLSFFLPINFVWANYLIIAVACGWLMVRLMIYYKPKYLFAILFAMGSIFYMLSVEYVFDNGLQAHQQMRIKIALGIVEDPLGDGYNVDQSKIAIGSGGLTGKGFLEGTQTKLKYVPEQDTDFIFCTIGEEQGFIGATAVIILFAFLILRIVWIGERQTSTFGRVYAYSVASIIFFHLFVNVGMVTGLVPVIGIPLPFFSYGGSSLWGFTLLIFILLSIDARR